MNLKKPIKVRFLKEAEEYFLAQNEKTKKKFLLAFEKTEAGIKGDWFEKLKSTNGIYEFRQSDHQKFYRIFAFWASKEKETLIIATHGSIKRLIKHLQKKSRRQN